MKRLLRVSDRAWLVEAADLGKAMHLQGAFVSLPGVEECVPGARTVLVSFDPTRVSADEMAERLRAAPVPVHDAGIAGEVVIPVAYDGEDLAETAALLDVTVAELVQRHQAATWTVAFAGFAPGFGYLVADDPLFDVSRRATPRTRVPAGAVALAGPFTGVYPRESPGGWQLIGRTDAVLFDVHRTPPALFTPGTRVRFVETVVGAPPPVPVPAPVEVPEGGSTIEVVQALQLLVQDGGRPGYTQVGVGASGIADRGAWRTANVRVGNAPDAPALEALGMTTLRFSAPGVVAVTGARGAIALTGPDGHERPVAFDAPVAVFPGDELWVGHPEQGLRYVIAVRGGIIAQPVLGSVATDTLAGLGPAPLRAGDQIVVGDMRRAPAAVQPAQTTDPAEPQHPDAPTPPPPPAPGELVELAITLGPRDDWFTPAALAALTEQEWQVTARSDRVGIRLYGQAPLERKITEELPSEGAVTGAIQVPADGQPVLFLADHPLTGGYPIIGALTSRALDTAAQLPPGSRVRFRVVDGIFT